MSLKRAYQQADAETILSVVLNGGELREEPAETVLLAHSIAYRIRKLLQGL